MNKDLKEKFAFTLGATHVGISHNIGGTLHRFVESFTHVGIFHITRRVAFTLAEVLITLGIIGIVSAMTIPTLVKKYQQDTWNTSATIFYQKLLEAIKVMNTQSVLSTHKTTEEFVEELSKHFKIVNVCSNDKLSECFSEKVYWGGGTAEPQEVDMSIIKISRNFGQKDWKTNIVGVQFANGVNSLIAYNPTKSCVQDPLSNQITGEDCFAILYDTTGDKLPNTSGKDLRANSNVSTLGSGCAFQIGQTCYTTAPFTPPRISKAQCEAIKNDLGIKECYEGDYWAGAVMKCGGVSKMPNNARLTELAKYIYDDMPIASSGYTYCPKNADGEYTKCMNEKKVLSLGFRYTSDTTLYIWSGDEYNSGNGYSRQFSPTNSYVRNWGRGHNFLQAVCLDN